MSQNNLTCFSLKERGPRAAYRAESSLWTLDTDFARPPISSGLDSSEHLCGMEIESLNLEIREITFWDQKRRLSLWLQHHPSPFHCCRYHCLLLLYFPSQDCSPFVCFFDKGTQPGKRILVRVLQNCYHSNHNQSFNVEIKLGRLIPGAKARQLRGWRAWEEWQKGASWRRWPAGRGTFGWTGTSPGRSTVTSPAHNTIFTDKTLTSQKDAIPTGHDQYVPKVMNWCII